MKMGTFQRAVIAVAGRCMNFVYCFLIIRMQFINAAITSVNSFLPLIAFVNWSYNLPSGNNLHLNTGLPEINGSYAMDFKSRISLCSPSCVTIAIQGVANILYSAS